MSCVPLHLRIQQAHAALASLQEACDQLPPDDQEKIAAEIDRFSSNLSQFLSPNGAAPSAQPASGRHTEIPSGEDPFYGSNQQLQMVLRGVRAGVFYKNLAGNTSTWSPELRTLIGVTPDEPASPEKFLAMIHPEDRERVREFTREAIKKGGSFYQEFRLIRPDGTVIWLSSVGCVEQEPDGCPRSITGINQDITDRKLAESALRESEQQAQQRLAEIEVLYQNAPIGLCVFDTQLRYSRINQRLAEINGVPVEGHLGKTVREVVPDLDAQAETALRAVLETGQPLLGLEVSGMTAAQPGVMRYWNENWAPIRNDQGAIVGISVAAEEITERKRAEAERDRLLIQLAEEQKQLKNILENMPVGVIIAEAPSGKILFQNRRIAELFQETPETRSVEDYSLWQAHYPDGTPYPPDKLPLTRTVRSGEVVRGEEMKFPVPDGKWITLNVNSAPIHDADGNVCQGILTLEDLSARRKAEDALRKSEEKFARAFHSSPAGLAITRLSDGRFLDVNDQLCHMTGYHREEILNQTTFDLGIYGSIEEREDFLRHALQQGGIRSIEKTIKNRFGQVVTALVSNEPVEVDGEACMMTTIIDITERKQAEEALRDSEAKFRGAFANASIGFAMTTPEGRFVDANPAYCKLTGYSVEELQNIAFAELVHPEDRAENLRLNRQTVSGEIPGFVVQNRYVRKDGQVVQVRKSVSVARSADGTPQWFVALVEDITERHWAETALEKAHAELASERNRLMAMMEAMPVGLSIYDENGGVIQANPGFEEVWGNPRPPANSVDDYDLYKAWWVESGQRVQAEEWAAARAVQKGETVTGQYIRIQKFDGTTGYILNSGAPVRDGHGRVTGAVVAIMDITDRVQTEKALQENQERFRVALSNVPLLVYTCDLDQRYTWAYNPLRGFRVEDVLGKRDDELLPHGAANELIAAKQLALDTGQGGMQEVKIPDGSSYHYYILTTEPVKDFRGQVVGLTCSAMDITEQKRLEIEQKENEIQVKLQRRLMEYREVERQELARDLHDGPIQLISGTIFHLQVAREAVQDPDLKRELENASRNMKSAVRELRDMMNELRPPAVIRFGFAKTARMHAEDFREKNPGIKLALNLFEDGDIIPEAARLALFRIYQESLTNIVKHANASKIWVRLTSKGSQVQLQIRDNGQGFQVPADLIGQTQRGHYGLAGMRERAEAAGGKLSVTSEPGSGTKITVNINLEPGS